MKQGKKAMRKRGQPALNIERPPVCTARHSGTRRAGARIAEETDGQFCLSSNRSMGLAGSWR